MGYLYVNFSLPRPLCSRLRLDVCDRQTDRQTDVRRASSLNVPWVGHNKAYEQTAVFNNIHAFLSHQPCPQLVLGSTVAPAGSREDSHGEQRESQTTAQPQSVDLSVDVVKHLSTHYGPQHSGSSVILVMTF